MNARTDVPCHVEELEAEQWAHRVMREEGIAVPRKMRIRANYVRGKIRQAIVRGAKSINKAAVEFVDTQWECVEYGKVIARRPIWPRPYCSTKCACAFSLVENEKDAAR